MEEGRRFGKLLTIEKVCGRTKKPRTYARWLCKCDCGGEKIVNESSLYGGHTTSCGCLQNLDKEKYHQKVKLRIEKSVSKEAHGCWIWKGAKHRQGYGNIAYRNKCELAHRISWIVFNGEVPKGMKVCHKCDVPSCCNPNHLFLGSQKENVNDAQDKGRWKPGNPPRRNKLNYEQVQEIKFLHEKGMTRKELEKKFLVSQTCIAKILTGVSWKVNWTKEL